MTATHRTVPLALTALLITALPAPAQDDGFEGYPTLNANELLKPEIVKGPHHLVLEPVPTRGFANQYTVETDWGTFPVWGNDLLLKRMEEFTAMAALDNASKSDEFKNSLRSAAGKPLVAIGSALQDPAGAVENLGAGAARFIRRAGEAIERGGTKSAGTDSTVESLVGLSKAKREIAAQLGVDPYTDNQLLQQRLDEMARAKFAGGFAITATTFALSAGANVGVASLAGHANLGANVANMIHDNSPLDLSKLNRDKLVGLGIGEAKIEAFLGHPAISPTQQTILTAQFGRLGPVPGLEDFLTLSLGSKNSTDARFFIRCAEMMADYHTTQSPAQRILNIHGLPAMHARSNALVIPLAVDYASWSPEADRLSQAVVAYQPAVEISARILVLSGSISPRARQELEGRGLVILEQADPRVYVAQAVPAE